MDELTERLRAVGARRKRLRDELAEAETELYALMPSVKARMTQEEIRRVTGLSFPTIRRYANP